MDYYGSRSPEGSLSASPPGAPSGVQSNGDTGETSESTATRKPRPTTRKLDNSKRAIQNRKAQQAYRDRQQERVNALERRCKELEDELLHCREENARLAHYQAVVDQLRVEFAAIRNSLERCELLLSTLPNSRETVTGIGPSPGVGSSRSFAGGTWLRQVLRTD